MHSSFHSSIQVLADLPLAPDKRVLFNALGHTPELGPPQAHAIADEFGSLGCLMAQLMDPAMCAGLAQCALRLACCGGVVCGMMHLGFRASRCLRVLVLGVIARTGWGLS